MNVSQLSGTSQSPAVSLRHDKVQMNARRTEKAETFCRVIPFSSHGSKVVIGTEENFIIARNPHSLTAEDSVRRYKVSKAFDSYVTQNDLYLGLDDKFSSSIVQGYNAALISFGSTGTGKTFTLFGNGSDDLNSMGIVDRAVRDIFMCIEENPHPDHFKVGVSCFDIHHNCIYDLLSGGNTDASCYEGLQTLNDPLEASVVETVDFSTAIKVIRTSRLHSLNWLSSKGKPIPQPNGSHSFIRISVINAWTRTISYLTVVDLIGSQTLNTSLFSHVAKSEKLVDRKIVNHELLCFGRLITEFAKMDERNAEKIDVNQLPSVKESLLTGVLGPLLLNCKIFLLATISPLAEDFLDSMNTLRITTRALSIPCVCTNNHPVPATLKLSSPKPFLPVTPQRTIPKSAKDFLEDEFGEEEQLSVPTQQRPQSPPPTVESPINEAPEHRSSTEEAQQEIRSQIQSVIDKLESSVISNHSADSSSSIRSHHSNLPSPIVKQKSPFKSTSTSSRSSFHREIAPMWDQSEYLMLKQNYDSVVALLQREERQKRALAQKLEDIVESHNEQKTALELQIEDLQGKVLKLTSKLKAMQNESDMSDCFQLYEMDMQVLAAQIERLTSENFQLEQRLMDAGQPKDEPNKKMGSTVNALKKALDQTRSQVKELTVENVNLKKKERVALMQQRALEAASRKTTQLSKALQHKELENNSLEDNLASWQAKYHDLELENRSLQDRIDSFDDQMQEQINELKKLTSQFLQLKEKQTAVQRTQIEAKIPFPVKGKKKEKISMLQNQSMGMHIITKLSDELGIIAPKYTTMLAKLKLEFQKMEDEKEELKGRENQLLNLISEFYHKDDPFSVNLMRFQDEIYKQAEKLEAVEKQSHVWKKTKN